VNVEALGLKTREPVGYLEELFAYRIQMAEAFLEAEVRQVVRADFITQERGELLVLLDECVLPVRPENVMAVLNLLQRSVELALQLLRDATAEDLGDLVNLAVIRHSPVSQDRSKILWMGKLRLKIKFRQYSIWAME